MGARSGTVRPISPPALGSSVRVAVAGRFRTGAAAVPALRRHQPTRERPGRVVAFAAANVVAPDAVPDAPVELPGVTPATPLIVENRVAVRATLMKAVITLASGTGLRPAAASAITRTDAVQQRVTVAVMALARTLAATATAARLGVVVRVALLLVGPCRMRTITIAVATRQTWSARRIAPLLLTAAMGPAAVGAVAIPAALLFTTAGA